MSFVNRGTSRHNAKNAKLGSLLDQFQCVGIGGNQGSDGNSIRRKIVIVRSIDYNYVINLHTADALHQHGDIYARREPNDPSSSVVVDDGNVTRHDHGGRIRICLNPLCSDDIRSGAVDHRGRIRVCPRQANLRGETLYCKEADREYSKELQEAEARSSKMRDRSRQTRVEAGRCFFPGSFRPEHSNSENSGSYPDGERCLVLKANVNQVAADPGSVHPEPGTDGQDDRHWIP